MEFLNRTRFNFSGRDINPLLGRNQFKVERRFSDLVPQANCPPGEFYYVVYTGIFFNQGIADNAIALANEVTPQSANDLSEAGTSDLDLKYPNAQVYRLAHALEHLAVRDIISRGKDRLQAGSLARTFIYRNRKTGKRGIAFYFRRDFAEPEDEYTGILNASLRIIKHIPT